MNIEELKDQKVSKIVAKNYRTAQVFSSHQIDFCCNGGVSLSEACSKKGVDLEKILHELNDALSEKDNLQYEKLELSELINHIVDHHHTYVKQTSPTLLAYLNKLCHVHGERHPELHEIKGLFEAMANQLEAHMKKEEHILFPFITAMDAAKKDGFKLSLPHFGSIENPISMMEEEHAAEGERLRKISTLSNHYQAPTDGCQTYKVAFAVLEEFEHDLHKHIHLENNILFPKARLYFKEIFEKQNQ